MYYMTMITFFNLCSPTVILNMTNTWTKNDDYNKVVAEKRCPELYPKSPCLVVFEKREERVYRATCGRANVE